MLNRRLSLLATILVASVAITGCGGDDGPDLTADLSAAQLLERSTEATADLESFTLGVDGTLTPEFPASPGTNDPPIDGPIEISGEGPVIRPDRMSLDATVKVGSLPFQTNLTRVGGSVFMTVIGRAYRLGLPEQQVSMLDISGAIPVLAGWITDPQINGEEDIDGQATVRITGTVDPDRVTSDLQGLVDGLTDDSAAADMDAIAERIGPQLTDGDTVTLWVRKNDLFLARVGTDIQVDDIGALTNSMTAFGADITLTLSDMNADLGVEEPTDAEDLSIDQLTRLLG